MARACRIQALPGEGRRHLAGIHWAQSLGDAVEVLRFHARGGQVISDVIGDGRELRLRFAQFGDGGGVISGLVRGDAQREMRERRFFGMRGGVGFDGGALRRRGRFANTRTMAASVEGKGAAFRGAFAGRASGLRAAGRAQRGQHQQAKQRAGVIFAKQVRIVVRQSPHQLHMDVVHHVGHWTKNFCRKAVRASSMRERRAP